MAAEGLKTQAPARCAGEHLPRVRRVFPRGSGVLRHTLVRDPSGAVAAGADVDPFDQVAAVSRSTRSARNASTRQYVIFWATTIPGRFPSTDDSGSVNKEGIALNHRIYRTTTRALRATAGRNCSWIPVST